VADRCHSQAVGSSHAGSKRGVNDPLITLPRRSSLPSRGLMTVKIDDDDDSDRNNI
jgi:hypothetical protein